MSQPIVFFSPVATTHCLPPPPNHQLKYKTILPPPPNTLKIISLFRNVQRSNTMGILENLRLSCKNSCDYDKSYQEIFCTETSQAGGLLWLCVQQSNLYSQEVISLLLQAGSPPWPLLV